MLKDGSTQVIFETLHLNFQHIVYE